jgi:hypothetical protein
MERERESGPEDTSPVSGKPSLSSSLRESRACGCTARMRTDRTSFTGTASREPRRARFEFAPSFGLACELTVEQIACRTGTLRCFGSASALFVGLAVEIGCQD